MHLHYLGELSDLYEVAALCDLAPEALDHAGSSFPAARRHRDWRAVLAELVADDEQRVTDAIGTEDAVVRRTYRTVLLDSMVHELNAVRGLLGEPTELRFVDIWGEPDGITATFAFGETECVFIWVDLPGIARYEQELAFYAPGERMALAFPSPFLRNMPTELVVEGGEPGTPAAWRTVQTTSYDE